MARITWRDGTHNMACGTCNTDNYFSLGIYSHIGVKWRGMPIWFAQFVKILYYDTCLSVDPYGTYKLHDALGRSKDVLNRLPLISNQ